MESKRKKSGRGGSRGQDNVEESEGGDIRGEGITGGVGRRPSRGDGRRDGRGRDSRGESKEKEDAAYDQVDSHICEPDSSNDASRTPPKELIDLETFAKRHGFQFHSPQMM